ncbi:PilZ domain-containing protein [Peribacillus alkalitolerans]|uniref:PilZ domain-containing protein n=1 Tax=Peribacillus alkalitolerans TaxID=1550385 RepID=UPI0013D67097|nr:PilZ domain-containing protein [Peribacillus alkalitolerans]
MDEIWVISNEEIIPAALFFIEGELMNVIIKQPELFEPGEIITFLIDRKRIHAKLIKKQGYNLYLYISLSEAMLDIQRRKAVRSQIKVSGTLTDYLHSWEVEVLDISMKGLAFTTKAELQDGSYTIAFTIENQPVTMMVTIRNLTFMQNSNRYGCTIEGMKQQNQFAIRRYILMDQLQRLDTAVRQ